MSEDKQKTAAEDAMIDSLPVLNWEKDEKSILGYLNDLAFDASIHRFFSDASPKASFGTKHSSQDKYALGFDFGDHVMMSKFALESEEECIRACDMLDIVAARISISVVDSIALETKDRIATEETQKSFVDSQNNFKNMLEELEERYEGKYVSK